MIHAAPAPALTLETDHFHYVIAPDGTNLEFVDRSNGRDYLRRSEASPCAFIRQNGKQIAATEASRDGDQITLRFGASGVEARLKVTAASAFVAFTVESVNPPEVDSLHFLNIPLTLQGTPREPSGACALSLNLITRVDALPALQRDLRASCEKRFGLVGAKAALVGAPMDQMLRRLQETLSAVSELPVCKEAGPWAQETPFNHGSYLFNFGSLTETNVEDWVEMTRSLGFNQIDNHGGGGFFRFGDLELNRQKWPDGWESFRRIVARLHTNGIGSIFHSYAFFIDKRSKYVTPVPDPRLDAFRTFTLTEPINVEGTEITVQESTAGLSTITGFFEHNSVVLHLGDELVTFSGVRQQAPWGFTGLKRGALGTQATAHNRGVQARHLKECFGLFVPNPESSLFEEIAANHAEIVNRCDFDGIYLDAIDGSSILRGGDECWYWADKFVVEIQKRLKKPVGMEMSAMWHHFWQYRTRWQAWDYPQRGHRRFIDLHAESVHGGLLLPLHLGWWNFQSFNPPQVEPSYPEVMEYLGAKLIGWDAGISLTGGVDREKLRTTPLFRRAVDILRTCEELRHAKAFDESAKAKLREPGQEFALFRDAKGKTRFRRSQSVPHTVALAETWTLNWAVTNSFVEQPVQFRLEALMAADSSAETNLVALTNPASETETTWKCTSATGVTFALLPSREAKSPSLLLNATNSSQAPRTSAWSRLEKRFAPALNLKNYPVLSVEIEGDGSGSVLALLLGSPQHMCYVALAELVVVRDFS